MAQPTIAQRILGAVIGSPRFSGFWRAGQEQHPFEIELPQRLLSGEQVAVVRRIERAAEQAEPYQLTEVPPRTSRLISVPCRSE